MRTFAIIPAAGRSERMGQPKLLLPWGEATVIEAVLTAWQAGGVDQRIVVVHPDDVELAAVCHRAGACVVVAETPPLEMRDSVQIALQLVEERFHPIPDDAWLLAPADMPGLSPELIRALIASVRSSAKTSQIIAPQLADGRWGHPVLFRWPLAAEVAGLSGGVKELLERHPVQAVPSQDGVEFGDIDTPDDYHRLHNRYNANAATGDSVVS